MNKTKRTLFLVIAVIAIIVIFLYITTLLYVCLGYDDLF